MGVIALIRRRLSEIAFVLLVIGTIGAFLLIQMIKTANPLVWGDPQPVPTAFDPHLGRICTSRLGQPLNYKQTDITVAVSHADTVGVYIVSEKNAGGRPVAVLSQSTPMQATPGPADPEATSKASKTFTWNGHVASGAIAHDGLYFFRVVLKHERRTINFSNSPVRVITRPPNARVLSVQPLGARKGKVRGSIVLTPPEQTLRIHYTAGDYRRVWVDVYRIKVGGKPRLVLQLPAEAGGSWARWNGKVDGRLAPAGSYLFGITAQNAACDQNSSPVVNTDVLVRYPLSPPR